MQYLRRWWLELLGLLLITIFFAPLLVSDRYFYCCDNLLITIPIKEWFVQTVLTEHTFPLYNPWILTGVPYLADLNLTPLSPWNLLYFLTDVVSALRLLVFLQYLVLWIGMVRLLRYFRFSTIAVILGSITVVFSGTTVMYIGNVPLLQGMALIPWVCWTAFRWCDTTTLRHGVTLGAVLALMLLSSHPQLTFYAFMFVAILCGAKRRWRSGLVLLGVLGVTAIQWIPFVELALSSSRVGSSWEYATQGSLPWWTPLRLLLPAVTGFLDTGTVMAGGGSLMGTISVASWLFVFVAFRAKRTWQWWIVSLSALLSFAFSFGLYSPVYWLAYTVVPGVSLMRVPAQAISVTTIMLGVLTAYGVDQAGTLKRIQKLSVGIVLGALVLASLVVLPRWLQIGEVLVEHLPRLATKVDALGVEGTQRYFIGIGFSVITQIAVVFGLWGAYQFSKQVRHALMVLIVVLDCFLLTRHGLITYSEPTIQTMRQELRQWQTHIMHGNPSEHRVYVDHSAYPAPPEYARYNNPLAEGGAPYLGEVMWQHQMLRPNLGMTFGISHLDGYASMIPRSLQDRIALDTTQIDPTGIQLTPSAYTQAETLGLRYIILGRQASVSAGLRHVFSTADISLYELAATPPKPAQSVSRTYRPRSVVVGGILSGMALVLMVLLVTIYNGKSRIRRLLLDLTSHTSGNTS